MQNCKFFIKIVELSFSNVLLKIGLESNDEINTSQVTKKISVANLEAVCNEKIVDVFFKDLTATVVYL